MGYVLDTQGYSYIRAKNTIDIKILDGVSEIELVTGKELLAEEFRVIVYLESCGFRRVGVDYKGSLAKRIFKFGGIYGKG